MRNIIKFFPSLQSFSFFLLNIKMQIYYMGFHPKQAWPKLVKDSLSDYHSQAAIMISLSTDHLLFPDKYRINFLRQCCRNCKFFCCRNNILQVTYCRKYYKFFISGLTLTFFLLKNWRVFFKTFLCKDIFHFKRGSSIF